MTTWSAIRLSLGIVLVVGGSLLLVASIPAAVIAAGIESSVGRSGVVTSSMGTLRAADGDRAVVVDQVSASLVAPAVPPWAQDLLDAAGSSAQEIAQDVGEVVLVATPRDGTDIFVGTAPVDAVNDYLDGSAYSVAVRPTPGEDFWPTVSVPGDQVPGRAQDQMLWTASAYGAAPELLGTDLDGETLVLMRTDAGPGPQAALRLEYRVPEAPRALHSTAIVAAAASTGGVALVLLGGALVVGRRRRA